MTHIIQVHILFLDETSRLHITGTAQRIDKLTPGIGFHIFPHDADGVGGDAVIMVAGGLLGMGLPVHQHHIVSALPGKTHHLHHPVRLMGMGHLGTVVLQAKIRTPHMAAFRYIMTDKA